MKSQEPKEYSTLLEFQKDYIWDSNNIEQLLGEGGFGQVWKAFSKPLQKEVAIKIARVNPDPKQPSLENELKVTENIPEHENLAHYDKCHRFNISGLGLYDYAIMEYFPEGDLAKLIKGIPDKRPAVKLTNEELNYLIEGLLNGIDYLHRYNIIHRDLKPQNILIEIKRGKYVPKIADFGLSRVLKEGDFFTSEVFQNSKMGGSLYYMAPEQLRNAKMRINVDLWAFGVILYQLLTREVPFRSDGADSDSETARIEVNRKINEGILPKALEEVPEPYQTMIRWCLVTDINKRVLHAEDLRVILKRLPAKIEEINKLIISKDYPKALALAEAYHKELPHCKKFDALVAQCRQIIKSEGQEKPTGEILITPSNEPTVTPSNPTPSPHHNKPTGQTTGNSNLKWVWRVLGIVVLFGVLKWGFFPKNDTTDLSSTDSTTVDTTAWVNPVTPNATPEVDTSSLSKGLPEDTAIDEEEVSFGSTNATGVYFTIGSTKEDVLAVQGQPTNIDHNSFWETWEYGNCSVKIQSGVVVAYDNNCFDLKVKLNPYQKSNLKFFTVGSTKDEVLSVQGQPDKIDHNSFWETWEYGNCSIKVQSEVVVSYNNNCGNLKIKLRPENKSKLRFYKIGSTSDEVLSIQGQPDKIDHNSFWETWEYGNCSIKIQGGTVVSFNNNCGSLKIKM